MSGSSGHFKQMRINERVFENGKWTWATIYFLEVEQRCSSERLNDLITVSSTWELTPVGTRYS